MGFGKDGKGAILRDTVAISAGTLAQGVAVIGGGLGLQEDFRILKTEVVAGIVAMTEGQGQGLLLGIANGDLTIAQIAECLDANGPIGPSDRLQTERTERSCHVVGVLNPSTDNVTAELFKDKHTGAPFIVDKFPWTYSDDDSWQWFVFNPSPSGLTTGATVYINGLHYRVWVV